MWKFFQQIFRKRPILQMIEGFVTAFTATHFIHKGHNQHAIDRQRSHNRSDGIWISPRL